MSALATHILTYASLDNVNGYLTARGIPAVDDGIKGISLALKVSGARTQGDVAALAINLSHGTVTGDQLTDTLRLAFPNDKVGPRHGPHYLSHARTGKIKVDYLPSKGTRGAATATPTVSQATVDELLTRIAHLESLINGK